MKTLIRHAILAIGIAVFAAGVMPSAASSASSSNFVFPQDAQPYGRTIPEWTAAWWQWAASMPTASHPLFDTGACDAGQQGPVWFLGGVFTGVAGTRDCIIPAGKSILFPALNVECSNAEPPPFFGSTEAELRDCVHAFMAFATEWFATLDGQLLQISRVESPLFEFTAVPGSLFGNTEPLSGISVSDGQWVFLGPLPGGQHTLHFGGQFDFPDGTTFPIDVTYNLSVRGNRGHGRTASDPSDPADASWGVIKQLFR